LIASGLQQYFEIRNLANLNDKCPHVERASNFKLQHAHARLVDLTDVGEIGPKDQFHQRRLD